MAWVVKREISDGGTRLQVPVRDVDGIKRSAGTFASRREAVKAGRRIDSRLEDRHMDQPRSRADHLPRLCRAGLVAQPAPRGQHRAAYRSDLDRHFLPFFGSRTMRSLSISSTSRRQKAHADAVTPGHPPSCPGARMRRRHGQSRSWPAMRRSFVVIMAPMHR